ncbi:MAG: hypothetical protein ACTSPT_01725 [Candidatus Heimdallarchaeota archaeon]
MIAISKEFKQLIEELFTSRGVTEIPINDLTDMLAVTIDDLKKNLQDKQLNDEYKLVQSDDGAYYVKRIFNRKLEAKQMKSSLDIQWDNIGGCPCFTCYELDRCEIGNPISSVDCPLFSKWLFKEPQEEEKKEEK